MNKARRRLQKHRKRARLRGLRVWLCIGVLPVVQEAMNAIRAEYDALQRRVYDVVRVDDLQENDPQGSAEAMLEHYGTHRIRPR